MKHEVNFGFCDGEEFLSIQTTEVVKAPIVGYFVFFYELFEPFTDVVRAPFADHLGRRTSSSVRKERDTDSD